MATGYQNETISPEEYDIGKACCLPLWELDIEGVYTLRTTEEAYLRRAGAVGSYATDFTVRLIGKNSDSANKEVAFEHYDNNGEAAAIDIKSVDEEGILYKNPQAEKLGADIGYLLRADDSLGVKDGWLVERALIPLRARKAVELKALELPLE